MPSSTLEIRWFFSGSLEQSGSGVEVWFTSRPRYGGSDRAAPIAWDPAPPAWRQDRYLLVPGSDDMGIKWREGRLEIKGRTSTSGPRVFAPGIAGECEHWLKWSYAGEAIDRRFHDCLGTASRAAWLRSRSGACSVTSTLVPQAPWTRYGPVTGVSAASTSSSRRFASPDRRATCIGRSRSKLFRMIRSSSFLGRSSRLPRWLSGAAPERGPIDVLPPLAACIRSLVAGLEQMAGRSNGAASALAGI